MNPSPHKRFLLIAMTVVLMCTSSGIAAHAQERYVLDALDVERAISWPSWNGIYWPVPVRSELSQVRNCFGNCGAGCTGRLDAGIFQQLPASVMDLNYKVCGGYRHWEVEMINEPRLVDSYIVEECETDEPVIVEYREDIFEVESKWAFYGLYTLGCEVHDFITQNPWDLPVAEDYLITKLPVSYNPVWLNIGCTNTPGYRPTPEQGLTMSFTWLQTKARIESLAREWGRESGPKVWGPTDPITLQGRKRTEIGRRYDYWQWESSCRR